MVLRLIRLRMASCDTPSWAAACATVRRSSAKSYTRPVWFSLFLVSHPPNLASRRAAPRYVLRGSVALKNAIVLTLTACLFPKIYEVLGGSPKKPQEIATWQMRGPSEVRYHVV